MAQLAHVNKWTKEECDKHLDDSEKLWFQRNQINWSFDLSLLNLYDVRKVVFDLAENKKIPPIMGISLCYRNVSVIFEKLAAYYLNRKLAREFAKLWPKHKWQQLANCPIWFLDIARADGQSFRCFDCTTQISLDDYHIDSLKLAVKQVIQNEMKLGNFGQYG